MVAAAAAAAARFSERAPLVVDCKHSSVMDIVNGVLLATTLNLQIDWKDGGGGLIWMVR